MTVLVIGIALWVAPVFLNGNPILGALAKGLRIPAQLLTCIGAVLLVIYALVRRAAEPEEEAPSSPRATTPRRSRNATERKDPVMAPLPSEQQPPALTSWNDDVLAVIEWRRFEALVEALFAQAGFETRSQSHGADGGVDIWLHSKNAEGPVAVVQCKHWQGKPVGVREMREFLGVMVSHGLQRGTYATSSTYTSDALAFAKANGINAQDGSALLRMIRSRSPEQQAALLAVATEGEYWRPTCASCGVKMVERAPENGGAAFWGCVNYPRCRATLPMRNA
ncbi:restriction endonuclease [Hydrogenophaga sp. RWCD_12]|uniref:restriction endonuclease n=1 Tax=Hydrogenophaga sp. RWCD_12 TaxID=3391190 RepID=UPI003984DED4